MGWTEDADLHKQFKDWREETELLCDTSVIKYQEPGNKAQVCQSMGWKGSKDISQHSRSGQKKV